MKVNATFKLTKIKWDIVAFDTLRTSPGADRAVQDAAEKVRDAANRRYAATGPSSGDVTPYVTEDPVAVRRGRRTVWTNDYRANYYNVKDLTLLNALGDVEGSL